MGEGLDGWRRWARQGQVPDATPRMERMPRRLFRFAITWLMLLALPLQGLASAGGWGCHAASERLLEQPLAGIEARADAPGPRVPDPDALHHDGQEGAHPVGHAGDLTAASGDHRDGVTGTLSLPLALAAGCPACANCPHAVGLPASCPSLGVVPVPAVLLAWVLPHWPQPDWPVADKPPRA